jgi:hypothetical protein
MDKTFVIRWESKQGGRCGHGKKFFTREEAEALATELDAEHPDFHHEALRLELDNIDRRSQMEATAVATEDEDAPWQPAKVEADELGQLV